MDKQLVIAFRDCFSGFCGCGHSNQQEEGVLSRVGACVGLIYIHSNSIYDRHKVRAVEWHDALTGTCSGSWGTPPYYTGCPISVWSYVVLIYLPLLVTGGDSSVSV